MTRCEAFYWFGYIAGVVAAGAGIVAYHMTHRLLKRWGR